VLRIAGRLLLWGAALTALWAAVTFLTGGFILRVGPIALSAHDPIRPLLAAIVLVATARACLPRDEFARLVRVASGSGDATAARVAVAASLAVLIASIAWNTRASGGSDSSCYLLQADAFVRGELLLRDPLAEAAPFPNAGALFAPTGFIASPVDPRAAVPICAPGLALLMALTSVAAGRQHVFLVVPILAACAVWLTFVLGRRSDSALTGAAASMLLACSPIFLYQAVQPMSDVPAVTLWLGALVACARRTIWGDLLGGACAGLMVVTRPNLALLVGALVLLIAFAEGAPRWRDVAIRLVRFSLGAAPLLIALAWINTQRYGYPLATGYGDTGTLFAMAHVRSNMMRYPRWLIAAQTPFILLAAAAPWWAWRRGTGEARSLTMVILVSAALLLATYLAYVVFDDWWYLRFLLPAIPGLLVLSVAVSVGAVRRLAPRRTAAIVSLSCVALGAWLLHAAQARAVFSLQALEHRFVATGRYASRALPERAVVLAVQQSGSIRYHGGRSTLTWDAVEPSALDLIVRWLIEQERQPYVALEDVEEPAFRRRFATQVLGALDWPPMAEVHTRVRVRVYDVMQRARYRRGEVMSVQHIR
jgi:hypothetical protein